MVEVIAFTIEELKDYSAKAGLGLQFVVKEAFIFELMEIIGEMEFILKGGTGVNKGYLQGHQRFSDDLDYDTNYDKGSVKKMLSKIGWKIKKEFYTKNSIGFFLQYSFGEIVDVVKVEVSFGIAGKFEKRKVVSDFLPLSKRVNIYGFKELNLQKEHAFEERREWKDLYDLYWMKTLYPKEFIIKDKKAFENALETLLVPKTANSFIPRTKRLNWKEVKEKMKQR